MQKCLIVCLYGLATFILIEAKPRYGRYGKEGSHDDIPRGDNEYRGDDEYYGDGNIIKYDIQGRLALEYNSDGCRRGNDGLCDAGRGGRELIPRDIVLRMNSGHNVVYRIYSVNDVSDRVYNGHDDSDHGGDNRGNIDRIYNGHDGSDLGGDGHNYNGHDVSEHGGGDRHSVDRIYNEQGGSDRGDSDHNHSVHDDSDNSGRDRGGSERDRDDHSGGGGYGSAGLDFGEIGNFINRCIDCGINSYGTGKGNRNIFYLPKHNN